MIKPDYRKNGIVNLASAFLETFGIRPLYTPTPGLDLGSYDNVVFILIDGLGYRFLQKFGKGSFLKKNCVRRLTSTFPSTTAAAATSLETGVAPQQHGITGWFMFLKELGTVAAVLPFKPRFGDVPLTQYGIRRSYFFTEKRIVEKIKSPTFAIYPKSIAPDKAKSAKRKTLAYKNLSGMLQGIKTAIQSSGRRKFIHAYWSKFDSISHHEGPESLKAQKHFQTLDKAISKLAPFLKKTNSTLIISADHGQIATPETKAIHLKDHPKLMETLTLPPCGEPRAAYCYVRPDKVGTFKKYIRTHLSHCCRIFKSSTLLNKGFFGLGKPHPRLNDRIGDYTLIMKENYVIHDLLLHEKRKVFAGNHGGLSPEEMFVPLIWVKPG
jgi:hypothetical protein